MVRTRRRSRLSVEPLERRDTPAGGITAVAAGGVLTVTGDDWGNVFTFERRGDTLRIDGTDTLINGSAAPFLTTEPVNSIKVTTLGGADSVSIATDADFVLAGP